MSALDQARQPPFGLIRATLQAQQHCARSVYEQRSQIRVAALADGSEASSETARVLARREAKVTREVARRGEAPCVTDERDKAGGREEADAGDRPQAFDGRHGGRDRGELLLHGAEADVELAELADHRGERWVQHRGDSVIWAGEQCGDPGDDLARPNRDRDAELPEQAADNLMRAVRVASQVERRRWRPVSACWVTDFTGTGWIVALRAASSKAVASARSVLLRGTYGRTACGGRRTTRWPEATACRPQKCAMPQASITTVAGARVARNRAN